MAKKSDNPFGDEYQKIIEDNKRREDLGVDESGERIKRPMTAKARSTKKRTTVKDSKGRSTSDASARLKALKNYKPAKLINGQIPASPTR